MLFLTLCASRSSTPISSMSPGNRTINVPSTASPMTALIEFVVILRPFLRMEVEELLDGYSRQGQIALTPAERDLIWNMAGGYPFFVQMAGYYLIEGKMQGLSDQSLSDFTLNNFTQQSSGHFAHLWSTCSDGEKSMLIAILALGLQKKSGWAVSSLENLARVRSRAALDLPALNKRGLLDENAKIYSIFSRTFGNWIQQEILALSGEEETDSNVDELLRKQTDILKPLKDTLPLFKKKYWPILIDIAKGFTAEADPATLLRLLK